MIQSPLKLFSTKTPYHILLILITLFFCKLVINGISEQGILYYDAGSYLLDTKFLNNVTRPLTSFHFSDYRQPTFWEKASTSVSPRTPLDVGKPGFNFILWVASNFLGVQDDLSARVGAIFSILGLFLTFLITTKLGFVQAGIYASTMLASSTFYLLYARSGYAEQVTMIFFLIGLFLYLKSLGSSSKFVNYLVGLSLGYAFTSNQFRVLYMPFLIIGVDFFTARRKQWGSGHFFHRLISIFIGFLTPLLIFQVVYIVAEWIMGPLPFRDYWSQLIDRWRFTHGGLTWFQGFGEMALSFWTVEGPFFSTLAIMAWGFILVRFLRKQQFKDLLIISFSLVPFIYFSLMKWEGQAYPRTAVYTIPIVCIGIGEMIFGIQRFFNRKVGFLKKYEPTVAAMLIVILLAQAFPRLIQGGITQSGYAQASNYLKSTGENKFLILAMEPIWWFYLGRNVVTPGSLSGESYPQVAPKGLMGIIKRAKSDGIKYLLIDYASLTSDVGGDVKVLLLGKQRPIARFSNPRGNSLPYLLDEYGLRTSRAIAQDPWSREIFVFDIRDIAATTQSVNL